MTSSLIDNRIWADRRYTGRHRLIDQPSNLERASEKFEELAIQVRQTTFRARETGLTWASRAVESTMKAGKSTMNGLVGVREVLLPSRAERLDAGEPGRLEQMLVVAGLVLAASVIALALSLGLSTTATSSRDTAPPASPTETPCEGQACVTPTGDPPVIQTPLLSATIGPSDDSDRIGPAPSRAPLRSTKD